MNNTIEQILGLLRYNPDQPLIFTDGFFLFLFLGFLIVYNMLKKQDVARIFFVILFSLYFYYKTSGLFVLLLIGVAVSDFVIAMFINDAKSQQNKKLLLALSCCINLGLLCYFNRGCNFRFNLQFLKLVVCRCFDLIQDLSGGNFLVYDLSDLNINNNILFNKATVICGLDDSVYNCIYLFVFKGNFTINLFYFIFNQVIYKNTQNTSPKIQLRD